MRLDVEIRPVRVRDRRVELRRERLERNGQQLDRVSRLALVALDDFDERALLVTAVRVPEHDVLAGTRA